MPTRRKKKLNMSWVKPLGFAAAGLVVLAFFLPWARLEADTLINRLVSLPKKIVAKEQVSWVDKWLWMREEEWERAWHSPGEGLSGYQLMMTLAEDDISSKLAREWMSMMFDSKEAGLTISLLVLAPIFALAIAVGLLIPSLPKVYFVINGIGSLLYYVIVRWKLNGSIAERVISHVELSYGLWITLYGMVFLALTCVLKMVWRD